MKSVICAIVKNEQRFIREWVEHYLNIGFDKLYIFEDYGSDTHYEQIKDYIKDNKVILNSLDKTHYIKRYKKGTSVQRNLYLKFLMECKKTHNADWIGFFDVDEFMFFEDGWDLEKLENEFKDYGGILLAWRTYGANGHLKRPEGNVVDNYTKPMPDQFVIDSTNCNVKSLVNVSKCNNVHIHISDGCVATDHEKLKYKQLCFSKAWINHYFTKSWEDYLDRIFARGNMQNNFRCLDKFFKCNPELKSKEKEMIFAQRYKHTASTMWISRKYKIISGGNVDTLKKLNAIYRNKN